MGILAKRADCISVNACMYRVIIALLSLALVAGPAALVPSISSCAMAASYSSSINNPSAETADSTGTAPLAWTQDNWGTNNAVFQYSADAYEGACSLYVSISGYSDGDAKWSFDPVQVNGGSTYTFTDYYKASVPTYLIARYIDTSGNTSYEYYGEVPAASSWTYNSCQFTVPSGAAGMTMLHLVASNGELWTDCYTLTETPGVSDPAVTPGTTILNPSVETASVSGTTPQYWSTDNWGSNTADFQYTDGGQDGSKCMYVKVSNYGDGDAKWSFNPVLVTAGKTYTFTDYYKSTDKSYLIARYWDASGNESYVDYGEIPASPDWTKNTCQFTAPAGMVKMTMLHLIASNGELWTDNYDLVQSQSTTDPVVSPGTDILNPSAETASSSGTAPQYWFTDSWGTNSTDFQYKDGGQSGSKCMYVKLSNYTDGDAKWSFNPVLVTAGKTFTFTDYYKSTVKSYLIARYFDSSGTESYVYYGEVPTSPDWSQNSLTFTVPAGATSMTMLHLISSNGELWTDNYSLSTGTAPDPEPVTTNLIPNPSLETASGSLPAEWSSSKWGTNKVTFAYQQTGHTGNCSVKATVSSYTSGDAKWAYEPVTVTPGAYYEFSDYYQSDVSTQITICLVKQDGTEDYIPLHNAPASTSWAKYRAAFTVPSDTVKVGVYHMIAMKGYLVTDDYSLTPATPRSFNRPLLTLTFDDGWEENYLTALPVLESYGFKTTQFYATTYLSGSSVDLTGVKTFIAKGHETGSHSVNHPDLTTVTAAVLTNELKSSQAFLETLAGTGKVNIFAAPYGTYNDKVRTAAQLYYDSYRSTDEGYNSRDDFDPYNVKVQNILSTTTAADVQGWVAQAQATNTWLVLVYHRVGSDPGEYDSLPADFQAQMAAVKNSGITVKTYSDALAEVQGQL